MKLAGVNYESMADGEGIRTTLFISGCKHNCKGCHNKAAQAFDYGVEITPSLIKEIRSNIVQRPFLSGITLSGGDPMYSAKEVIALIDELVIPNNDIWCYTGFKLCELTDEWQLALLARCSHLIDGEYIESLRDITLSFRGSSNQIIWKNNNGTWLPKENI